MSKPLPTTSVPQVSAVLLPMLSAALTAALTQAAASRVVLALSGGMDSMVLLALLHRLDLNLPVKAVYVHHGLSPNADA